MTAVPLEVAASRPSRSTASERLAAALQSLEGLDPRARTVAERAVAAVVELYGEGIARLLSLADAGVITVDRIVADEQWTALLALHGLHPVPVEQRVERALESVRPYLGTHHGG